MQYSAVQCSAVQCRTKQGSAIQCSAAHCSVQCAVAWVWPDDFHLDRKHLSWWLNTEETGSEHGDVQDYVIDAVNNESLFRGPILIIGGYVINKGYPVRLLPLCRVGVTIISFSRICLVITRPALYKKKPAYMLEMNITILRPH